MYAIINVILLFCYFDLSVMLRSERYLLIYHALQYNHFSIYLELGV